MTEEECAKEIVKAVFTKRWKLIQELVENLIEQTVCEVLKAMNEDKRA